LALLFYKRIGCSDTVKSSRADVDYIFHLIGADEKEGIERLQDFVGRDLEHKRGLASSEKVLAWAHEYDPVLDPDSNQMVNYLEALVLAELHGWPEAIDAFRTLSAKADPGSRLYINACCALARGLGSIGEFDEALLVGERARLRAAARQQSLLPATLVTLGRLLRDSGELAAAEKKLKEGAALATANENTPLAASAYSSLGSLYRKWNDQRAAIDAYQKSLTFLEAEADEAKRAIALSNVGVLFFDINEWEKGERSLNKALDLQREIGDRRGEAASLNNLARGYQREGRTHLAAESVKKSAEIFIGIGDFEMAAVAMRNTSALLLRENDAEGARSAAQHARQLESKIHPARRSRAAP
jgi:tetratricopeptide (TPR) repeat protein